jgi:glucose dehydrogenase
MEDPTDSVWPSRWLRLFLTGASLLLYPALAAAQMPTVPASAAPSDDGQWTMPGKNYAATRYSALDEINGANVRNLQVAFAFSTGVDRGQEAAPIVANNTMFIVTPYPNIVFALDLSKPGAPMKWSYQPRPAAASQGVL